MERKCEIPLKEGPDPLLKLRGVLRGAIPEGAADFVRELRRDKEPGGTDDGEGASGLLR